MANTLYFTNEKDPNYLQILVACEFINLKLPSDKINKKYDPLILVTP
jgi:hypothetical protein